MSIYLLSSLVLLLPCLIIKDLGWTRISIWALEPNLGYRLIGYSVLECYLLGGAPGWRRWYRGLLRCGYVMDLVKHTRGIVPLCIALLCW